MGLDQGALLLAREGAILAWPRAFVNFATGNDSMSEENVDVPVFAGIWDEVRDEVVDLDGKVVGEMKCDRGGSTSWLTDGELQHDETSAAEKGAVAFQFFVGSRAIIATRIFLTTRRSVSSISQPGRCHNDEGGGKNCSSCAEKRATLSMSCPPAGTRHSVPGSKSERDPDVFVCLSLSRSFSFRRLWMHRRDHTALGTLVRGQFSCRTHGPMLDADTDGPCGCRFRRGSIPFVLIDRLAHHHFGPSPSFPRPDHDAQSAGKSKENCRRMQRNDVFRRLHLRWTAHSRSLLVLASVCHCRDSPLDGARLLQQQISARRLRGALRSFQHPLRHRGLPVG
ncbi:hypothetical protein IWX48DRAFT_365520 [Phyllosticta citricarpa]